MDHVVTHHTEIAFTLNGESVSVNTLPTTRLSTLLREVLNQRDVKIGCNAGDCGACSVLVDQQPVCACLMASAQVVGKAVDTVSGLVAQRPIAQRLSQAFLYHGAAQCGICTPGMLVAATALLQQHSTTLSDLDINDVQDALAGVLCRCTGYRKIIDAVLMVAAQDSIAVSGVNAQNVVVQNLPDGGALHAVSQDTVGIGVVRLDGWQKVSGSDRFGDDVAPPDALVACVVRAEFHHAAFEFGDLSAFVDATDGIEAVFTAADIPGSNLFGVLPEFVDQPVFAESTTRYRGEAVAVVVGTAAAMQTFDVRQVPLSWTELPAQLSPAAAQSPDAEQLHTGRLNNVMCHGLVQRGDADAALAASAHCASGKFETGFIEHAYIEPEAGFAQRVGDRLEVHGCTQAAYMDRDALATILDLDVSAIRIVPTSTGGGFGSKLDLSFQPFVALAAWQLKRPVRMAYKRQESMQATTKRHPSQLSVSIGTDQFGKLTGMRLDGTFNTGAYASWGPTVSNRVPVHAGGPYAYAHYRAQAKAVHTHCAPAGAFRGFGVPQAAIAQEVLFDELALKLNMDRLDFRLLNALDNHIPTVTGQVFAQGVGIKACLQALQEHWLRALQGADKFNQLALNESSPLRRGIGIASGWYGCGNTSMSNPSTIKAGIATNGKVYLHQGAIDIGQGSNTVIAQIFASALGVPLMSIELIGADTDQTPDAGKTSASRQTFITGNAAKLAGIQLRATILRMTNCAADANICLLADPEAGIDDRPATSTHGVVVVNANSAHECRIDLSELDVDNDGYVMAAEQTYDPPTQALDEKGQGSPYAVFGYAAQMVELTVDTGLGTVKLDRFVAAHDVGKAINPVLVEGQIHGGIAQGVGLALMEEFIPGRTENLHDYLIPTCGDVPPIESIIVEVADPHGPFGAKGLGEHVLIPTAPSIINAVRDACDARIRTLPATPDRVLAAIQASRSAA